MNIIKFIDEVYSDSNLFHEIECDGTHKEAKALEKLCDLGMPRERLIEAWSLIISSIIDKFQNEKEVRYLTDYTLNFLITNQICLIDLGHLKLKDKWLLKIYEIDRRCWEALRTVEDRKSHMR